MKLSVTRRFKGTAKKKNSVSCTEPICKQYMPPKRTHIKQSSNKSVSHAQTQCKFSLADFSNKLRTYHTSSNSVNT